MTIEISIADIICRIIAAIGVILCIILYFYDRHKTAKWFKDNAKEESLEAPCYQKTSCLDCKMYDKENYYCPRFCEVIRDAVKDTKQNNYDEENIQDVLEQIKEIREETTKDGKVFTVLDKHR